MNRILLAYDGTTASSDLFQSVLTMLDPEVVLDLVAVTTPRDPTDHANGMIQREQEFARQLGRELHVHLGEVPLGPEIVRLAREGHYELLILALPSERPAGVDRLWTSEIDYVLSHAHCPVFLAAQPVIPAEVVG